MNQYLLVHIIEYKPKNKSRLIKKINPNIGELEKELYRLYASYKYFSVEIEFRRKFLEGIDKSDSVIFIPEREIILCALHITYENEAFLLSCFDKEGLLYQYISDKIAKTEKEYYIQDNLYYDNELCFDISEVTVVMNDFITNKGIDFNKFEELG